MAESTVVKTKIDGTLTFASQSTAGGGGFVSAGTVASGASSYVVSYEAGDFSMTVPGVQGAVNNFLDRGKITSPASIRLGDQAPITFSFTAMLRDVTDAGVETLMDILNQKGNVDGNWKSTTSTSIAADDAEVWTVDLKLAIVNPGDATDSHFIVLSQCALSYSMSEGDPNSISISGTSFAAAPQYVG
mgnify:CR=1 FL=1|tara:strand:- start:288 stop:851 length:564 start_codon:yes stop_codon:yes gene_type:complete